MPFHALSVNPIPLPNGDAISSLFGQSRGQKRIVVGDAHGIDEAVVRACEQQSVSYMCYGIQAQARNRANYINTKLTSFTARDEYMLSLADKVMIIWNGSSKGTLHVYETARQAGKTAWLMHYSWWLHPESDSIF